MKKLSGFGLIAFFIFLSAVPAGITSCTKENTVHDTVTVIKKDTVVVKDTLLSTKILTANPWKIKELRGVVNNIALYYLRGGSANTQSFDNEYIVFKADKTGNYVDNNGATATLVWNFGSSGTDSTKIIYTLSYPTTASFVITWDNVAYKNGMIRYDEYYTQNGANAHSQGLRMPR